MYFHGLSKEEILLKTRFESYGESCKQSQIRMVTLFGQKISFQVYSSKVESIGSGNGQVNRNCLNPLMNEIDLQLPENQESVECRECHSLSCSQDTVDLSIPSRIKGTSTNVFGKRSEKVITSCESGLLDLNETPVNESVANHQQCVFQDLNIPYTEVMEMSSEKSSLDDVHGKDSAASCCTVENNSSRTEREDSSEVTEMAAECLLYISTISLNQSQDLPFKHESRSNCSSQDQDFLNKHETGNEKPEYSYDSYELHTLGIRETSPEEECCVSSKSVDEFNNKKEFGVKVRRGRRMKNFQKEILPGLVSLSRHDIREDLNILEAVLRSKEYKNARDEDGRQNQINNKGLTPRYIGRRTRRRTK